MSSNTEVISVFTGVNLDSSLIHAAKVECDGLDPKDPNNPDPLKTYKPGQKCVQIIRFVQQECSRPVKEGSVTVESSVIVLHPGTTAMYLRSPSIVVPIEKDGLPTTMTTGDGKIVTVDWNMGRAWEVRQPVRLEAVNKKGGTLLWWY